MRWKRHQRHCPWHPKITWASINRSWKSVKISYCKIIMQCKIKKKECVQIYDIMFPFMRVLYCILVGSQQLVTPDILQPKAYCTNPGLYSFLLAPPGVSTRDRSSERRNYLGREIADEFFLKMPDFHVTFRDLLHAVNLRHGTNGFTSLPKEGVLRTFSPWKIRRLRPGLNPRTWVLKASTLPLDHRSRFHEGK